LEVKINKQLTDLRSYGNKSKEKVFKTTWHQRNNYGDKRTHNREQGKINKLGVTSVDSSEQTKATSKKWAALWGGLLNKKGNNILFR
jgi:hypothetical protein